MPQTRMDGIYKTVDASSDDSRVALSWWGRGRIRRIEDISYRVEKMLAHRDWE